MKSYLAFITALTLSLLACGNNSPNSVDPSSSTQNSSSYIQSSGSEPLSSSSQTTGSNPPNGKLILGKYQAVSILSKSVAVDASNGINQAVAIPLGNGGPWDPGLLFSHWVYTPVDSLGQFALDVDQSISAGWVVLLVDSAETDPTLKVKGFVGIGYSGDNLLNLPIATMSGDSLDLGTVSQDPQKPDEIRAEADSTTDSSSFTLSLDQLQMLAGNSSTVKAIKNVYLNATSTQPNFIAPRFFWYIDMNDAVNSYPTIPSIVAKKPQYAILLQLTGTSLAVADSGTSNVTLDPPQGIDIVDNAGIVTSAGVTQITGSDIRISASTDKTGYIDVGMANAGNEIPQGWWFLKKNGTTQIQFDVAAAYATDSVGQPRLFIPSFRINLTAASTLASVDIQWYAYQDNGYVLVTDPTLLDQVVPGGCMLGLFSPYDANHFEEYHRKIMPSQTSVSSFENPWSRSTSPATGTYHLSEMQLSYSINGIDYNFWVKE